MPFARDALARRHAVGQRRAHMAAHVVNREELSLYIEQCDSSAVYIDRLCASRFEIGNFSKFDAHCSCTKYGACILPPRASARNAKI
jgi:hypothetical protein